MNSLSESKYDLHTPVLLAEVLRSLEIKEGGCYVDATFGAGGYTKAILEQAPNTKVIALDRDANVLPEAKALHAEYGDRFIFIQGDFGNVCNHVRFEYEGQVDGIVFDIGVSSMQLDQAERGFSFTKEAPLDMRMDQDQELSAHTVVNEYEQEQLADIIYRYGDERRSRAVARAICAAREQAPIETTVQLAEIVAKVVPKGQAKIHPATRTFQAIRIEVNQELEQLKTGLQEAAKLVGSGGIISVVTFHSTEDRIVKSYFNDLSGKEIHSNRHMPAELVASSNADFELAQNKAIAPSAEEIRANPRARSAKLRVIRRR
jgi:16S rRNA (cytosine1402-N4)-methyltransferase